MAEIKIPNGVLTYTKDYKPGDLPPEGYLEWHAWAEVQYKAGIPQSYCSNCGKYHTPQELPCKHKRDRV